jgi:hypothetical protein
MSRNFDQALREHVERKGTYGITHANASIHQIVGRDSKGRPIEKKICQAAIWETMVDPAGNTLDVPLSNGRTLSENPEDDRRISERWRMELIQTGWLPIAECPHTTQYARVIPGGGPLVSGGQDCGGKPDGCEHLQAVVKERLAATRAEWDLQQHTAANMPADQVMALARGAIEGAIADAAAARSALMTGQGEPEPPRKGGK